jgi:hypothetical protein
MCWLWFVDEAAFKPISELDPGDVLCASSSRQVSISAAHRNRGSLSNKLFFSRHTSEAITFSEDVRDVTRLEGTEVARGGRCPKYLSNHG